MTMLRPITLLLSLFMSDVFSNIPSLSEISKTRDPVLIQIFRDSHIDLSGMSRFNEDPPPIPSNPNGQYSHGEVAINHESALGSSPSHQSFEHGIGKLAADGANVFYRGAQTVGNAFGLRQGNYHVPLLDAAAGLIG
ncbi:hypothetical protein PMAYCL1PPCAC_29564 [Pristionchus mayeri]|uniref:Uncharacterized protein n=1 Tax=Pristionchus mayeri TaxID=1317129 RepID=A0AAN5ICA2_9BILA|nr:hypothetical protein PMAYCL1PPCAC_29564 [Pristionchus mayeri]